MRLDVGRSSGVFLGLILTAITALVVLAFGLKKPYNNWDLVGYVAVAYSAEGMQGATLKDATFAAIKKDVDTPTFDLLTSGDRYRETVFKDPASLEQQLPFYDIRVLYMGAVRTLHAAGTSYPRATSVVSALFAAFSVLLLAFIAREANAPLATIPFVVAAAGFIEVARLSTPDAMATCFALLAIHGLARRSRLLFIVAILLPLVRTDFILLSGLMLGYTFLTGMKMRSVASFVVACAVYVLIVTTHHGYGWLTLFNTSLIAKTPYPATLIPSHAIGDYIRPYVSTFYGITMHPHFVIYGLAIGWWLTRKAGGKGRGDDTLFYALLVIPLAFVALHLLLFPANSYRFFIFAASSVALWLLGQIRAPGRP